MLRPVPVLPLVERELREQSRWQSLPWVRTAAALVAGLLTALVLGNASAWQSIGAAGRVLFDVQSWLLLTGTLVAGTFLGASGFLREHQDHTLGLLYLTPLTALDVLLGKLAAQGLQAFYLLLAVSPMLSVALLAGGVTPGEFWRALLVLLVTLPLALACGACASARPRPPEQALLRAAALVLALNLLPLLLELGFKLRATVSPVLALVWAGDANYLPQPGRFWGAILVIPAATGVLLALAGRELRLAWRAETPAPAPAAAAVSPTPFAIAPRLHAPVALPRPGPRNGPDPDWWLRQLQPGRWMVWAGLLGPEVIRWLFPFILARWFGAGGGYGLHWATFLVLPVLQTLLLASAGSRALAAANRSGALELLLVTPWPARTLARDHQRALWRFIRTPVLLAIVLGLVASALSVTLAPGLPADTRRLLFLYQVANRVGDTMAGVAGCWLAAWFAVRSPHPGRIAGNTILWVVALPTVGQLLLNTLVPLTGLNAFSVGVPLWRHVPMFVLTWWPVAYYTAVIRWAHLRLITRLRSATLC